MSGSSQPKKNYNPFDDEEPASSETLQPESSELDDLVKSVLEFNPNDLFPEDINNDDFVPNTTTTTTTSDVGSSSSSSSRGQNETPQGVRAMKERVLSQQSMTSDKNINSSQSQNNLQRTTSQNQNQNYLERQNSQKLNSQSNNQQINHPLSGSSNNQQNQGPQQDSSTMQSRSQPGRILGQRDMEFEQRSQKLVESTKSSFSNLSPDQKNDYLESLLVENQELKDQLAKIRKDISKGNTPKGCVDLMMANKSHDFHRFKSLDEKIQMLDYAIECGDCDAILDLTIFMMNTLKYPRVCHILQSKPLALNCYLTYLKRRYEFDEISKLNRALGRIYEEGMFLWWRAHRIPNPTTRLIGLEQCLQYMTKNPTHFIYEKPHLANHIELLKRQITIESHDAQLALQNDEIFVRFPRKNILYTSLIETLGYCSFYHYTATNESLDSSPNGIRKKFDISEKHYLWVALTQRAKLKDWPAFQDLVTNKSFTAMFTSKLQSAIGFEPLVMMTAKNGAPPAIIATYAREIKDPAKRYAICENIKLHEVVIESLVELRLRGKLLEYRNGNHLRGPTGEFFLQRIDAHLRDPKIRWRD